MYDDPVRQFDARMKEPEDTYAKLMAQVKTYLSEEDIELVERAYRFAKKAHEGQYRKSGEPYINHPTEVAYILSDIRMDAQTVAAALLHDTVEDTDVTREEIAEEFSEEIAALVDGVTKISNIEIDSLTEAQSLNFRKMLVAMSKDVRVVVIKLADRLHNMRTLMALPEDRRIFKAKETMEIYAPLANRLGINSIKWELEDLSFYYLEPDKYEAISRMVDESREAREEYLQQAIEILQAELDKSGIEAKITGRPKHLYSIYQKMTQRGKGFSEIYDLIALRIIVDTVKDCYSALGVTHTLWKPMPGRFKDYIAMPKFNMYQSLHTTVIGPAGRPLEVQIRTQEMHRINEYGIAAHWRYKESNAGKGKDDDQNFERQMAWLRSMLDWQDDTPDSKEFMQDLKTDLFDNEVFVFTPKGEVVSLRAGATPLDFAYSIHTEVGHHCVGAKVNGVIVPLSYELQSGDRVEILTQQNSSPSRDWLNIVKTPSARSKIKSYLSKASKGDDILHGRDVLGREMRKSGLGISSSRSVAALKKIAAEMQYADTDALFAAIGSGKLSGKQVANMMLKELQKDSVGKEENSQATMAAAAGMELDIEKINSQAKKSKRKRNDTGVVVKGVDDALVNLAKCCNPVPGDEIVGFVTRGRGVSVHRAECPNVRDLKEHPERFIEVEWESGKDVTYSVEIYVGAVDRTRLLQDVAIKLSDLGTNIVSANTTSLKDGFVEMRFVVETGSTDHIDSILSAIQQIEGVYEARRMQPGETNKKKH